jgi:hypothetical protein
MTVTLEQLNTDAIRPSHLAWFSGHSAELERVVFTLELHSPQPQSKIDCSGHYFSARFKRGSWLITIQG